MRTFFTFALFGIATFMLLTGCNTTAGAGKDLSAAGHAITKSANQHSY